jgi:hypothetical protein
MRKRQINCKPTDPADNKLRPLKPTATLSVPAGSGGTDGPDLGSARSVDIVTGLRVSPNVAVCWVGTPPARHPLPRTPASVTNTALKIVDDRCHRHTLGYLSSRVKRAVNSSTNGN